MTSGRSNLVSIECRLLHQTELAYLVWYDGRKVWVPKSVSEYDAAEGVLTLPEDVAVDKELV